MFLSLIKKLVGLAVFLVGLFFLFGAVMIVTAAVQGPNLSGAGWGLGGFFAVTSAMFLWVGWTAMQAKAVEQTARVSQPPSTKPSKRWKHGRSMSRIIGASIFCASLIVIWHTAACAEVVAEYWDTHNAEAAYAAANWILFAAIVGWVIGFSLIWPKTESEKTFDSKGREQPTDRKGCGCGLSCILFLFAAVVWTPQHRSLETPGMTASREASEAREARERRQVQEVQETQAKQEEAGQREQDRQFYRENRGKPDGYSVEKLKTLLRDKTMAQVRRLFDPPDDNAVIGGNEIWFYSNGIMNEATEKVDTLTVEFKKPLLSDSDDDSKVKQFGIPAGRNYKP